MKAISPEDREETTTEQNIKTIGLVFVVLGLAYLICLLTLKDPFNTKFFQVAIASQMVFFTVTGFRNNFV